MSCTTASQPSSTRVMTRFCGCRFFAFAREDRRASRVATAVSALDPGATHASRSIRFFGKHGIEERERGDALAACDGPPLNDSFGAGEGLLVTVTVTPPRAPAVVVTVAVAGPDCASCFSWLCPLATIT